MTKKTPIPRLDKPETLSQHVRHASHYPLLREDQEHHFAKRWYEHEDQAALKVLIKSHERLVKSIANGYRGYGLPLEDLISEGHIGMMQAVKGYNLEKGYRFSTYARWWIKAAIQEYVMKSWSLVKIGTTTAQKRLFFNLRRMKNKIQQQSESNIGDADLEQIAQQTGLSVQEVTQMDRRLEWRDESLNAPLFQEGDRPVEWQEMLEDHNDNHEVALIHQDELQKRHTFLQAALDCLKGRERLILEERRLKEPPKTLEEIGALLGLSKQRINQIEVTAFEKLQKETKRLALLYAQKKQAEGSYGRKSV